MKRTIVSLLLLCSSAFAQNTLVPPEVLSVTTIGRWQNGSDSGSYRITITTDGWEHVWSHVFLEWLPDPTSREEGFAPAKVVELIPPIAQGTAVLEAFAKLRKPNELVITVLATSNMELHAKARRFVFLAKEPGVVHLVKPSGNQ